MPTEKRKRAKKANRRARGTGSIFFHEGRQRWVGRRVIGKKANGEPLKVERWGETQGEVVKKLALVGPPGENETVAGRATRWRSTWTARSSTREGYANSLDAHILPALGHLKVAAVAASHVEQLVVALRAAGLAPGTVGKVLAAARGLFGSAVRDGVLDRNPVSVARKPKVKAKKIDPFAPDELGRIMDAAAGYAAGGVIAVLAGTGCRMGEALALDVPDYDPKAGTLSITKTYTLRYGVGPPKTEAGTRTVEVPDVLRPVLDAAVKGRKAGPLLPTRTGARRPAQNVAEAWASVLKKAGLAYRNPHQLRHSVATHLVAAGEPLADVAAYLGDKLETIVRYYAHPTGKSPVGALNRLYGGRKVGRGSRSR